MGRENSRVIALKTETTLRNNAETTDRGEMDCGDLDPADWQAYREWAHRMLDLGLDHIQGASDRPVWRPVPDEIKQRIRLSPPYKGRGPDQAAAEFADLVMPYATGNTHPRFFGWVHGTGTAGGAIAEFLAAAINANLGGREHAPIYIERQIIAWFLEIFGLPQTGGGLLVSGTSMATLLGLAMARQRHASHDVRIEGMSATDRPMVLYASIEAHGCIVKAAELLGLGRLAVRKIKTHADFTMDTRALHRAIQEDKDAGRQPFCVVATAGSVNTGAIDDIETIADIANDQGLWLHIDGAFGALAILSDRHRGRLAGIDRADSIGFDFHKWLHVPYDAGCILVRNHSDQLDTFDGRASYLKGNRRGLAAGDPWFCEQGIELSRGFRAAKVWFTLMEHGLDKLGRMITKNCAQAAYLKDLVDKEPSLEPLAPVSLNITCFRYVDREKLSPSGRGNPDWDQVNNEIVITMQERGIAAPSITTIDGKLAIRVNITNHRTTMADLDLLVETVLSIGRELLEYGR